MELAEFATSIGLNVTASGIYDLAKAYLTSTSAPTPDGLKGYLASHLAIDGATVKAERLVDFMAKNGNIAIQQSSVRAGQRITMASFPGTTLNFGEGSVASTDSTSIETGLGASIRMQGGGKVVQNPDGSIEFWA